MAGSSTTKKAAAKKGEPVKVKMGFIYKPDGVDEDKWQRWPFEPGRMDNLEAEDIEDATEWTFAEWQDKFFSGSMRAIHALLWIYLRRDKPDLTYDEVRFTDAETWFGLIDAAGNPVDSDLAGNEGGDDSGKASESDQETPRSP